MRGLFAGAMTTDLNDDVVRQNDLDLEHAWNATVFMKQSEPMH